MHAAQSELRRSALRFATGRFQRTVVTVHHYANTTNLQKAKAQGKVRELKHMRAVEEAAGSEAVVHDGEDFGRFQSTMIDPDIQAFN